jgi:cell division protein FtsN
MILAISALAAGIFFIFLLLRKKDNNKNKDVKAMSVSPLVLVVLASHLADPGFVTLYVFAGLAVAVWVAVLVIFILKKKNIIMATNTGAAVASPQDDEVIIEEPEISDEIDEDLLAKAEGKKLPKKEVEETEDVDYVEEVEATEDTEEVVEYVEEPTEDVEYVEVYEEAPEGENVEYVEVYEEAEPTQATKPVEETIEQEKEAPVQEKPKVAPIPVVLAPASASDNSFDIQYVSSFKAKLIQSSDDFKKKYIELKKAILSYKGTKSRITWHFETISVGKNVLLRFGIRGKTLCIYYALDYNNFENTKYKMENATAKKHSSAPCLYRIKNNRRFKYAMELIEMVAKKNNLVIGKEPKDDYYLPYEEKDALIEKGLIKKIK